MYHCSDSLSMNTGLSKLAESFDNFGLKQVSSNASCTSLKPSHSLGNIYSNKSKTILSVENTAKNETKIQPIKGGLNVNCSDFKPSSVAYKGLIDNKKISEKNKLNSVTEDLNQFCEKQNSSKTTPTKVMYTKVCNFSFFNFK